MAKPMKRKLMKRAQEKFMKRAEEKLRTYNALASVFVFAFAAGLKRAEKLARRSKKGN